MDPEHKKKVMENLNRSHAANKASRYGTKGQTTAPSKINSKGFQKLMNKRGVGKSSAKQAWNSFDKSSPVRARHAKKGELFMLTHGKNRASGNYVSKGSLGKTPAQRINAGALPRSNNATKQKAVRLTRNQDLVQGKIAAQPSFRKQDPKRLPRRGGGVQTLTDGGYGKKAGTVKNYAKKAANFRDKAPKGSAKNMAGKAQKNLSAWRNPAIKNASISGYAKKAANFRTAKNQKPLTRSKTATAVQSAAKKANNFRLSHDKAMPSKTFSLRMSKPSKAPTPSKGRSR